jgi:hypothetical protein
MAARSKLAWRPFYHATKAKSPASLPGFDFHSVNIAT